MGQIGPDITFDELKKQSIVNLEIIANLADRVKRVEAEMARLRKENERLKSELSARCTMEEVHLKQIETVEDEVERLEDRVKFECARADSAEKAKP